MKISDIENRLAQFRNALGDIEIYRGFIEYGHTSIDEVDLKNIIRLDSQSTLDHSNCDAITHNCRKNTKEFLVLNTNI